MATQVTEVIPVRWNDQTMGASFSPPHLVGGAGVVDPAGASPNGQLFLADHEITGDGHDDVVDAQGRRVVALDPEPLYRWSTDSSALCVMHHAESDIDDMRLGIFSLATKSERDIYRFHPEPGVALHGVLSCSPSTGRIVVEEILANSPNLAGPPTVAAVVDISGDGHVIARYDFVAQHVKAYVVASDDGLLFAESPVDPAVPGRILMTDTGRVVLEVPGQHVHAFDGRDETVVTADAPAAPGREDAPTMLRLIDLASHRVLWSTTGYLRGTLDRPGHNGLIIGVGSQRITVKTGYAVIFVGRDGKTRTLVPNGFFA